MTQKKVSTFFPGLRGRAQRFARRFLANDRGNVAIIFGVSLIPLMIGVGVAVDLSRAMVLRERLSQTIDAAALAAGATMNMTQTQQTEYVKKYIAANYATNTVGSLDSLSVAEANDVVTVKATAKMNTAFLSIIGYNSLTVTASTEVMRNVSGLELVMVLDNTGSMSGSKIDDLKVASQKLIDILFGTDPNPKLLKIGLVPFAAAVNVGTGAQAEGWIDDTGASTLAQNKMKWTAKKATVFDLYNKIPNRSWNGCVEARMMPYDTTDDAPSTSDTLFQPYFAPDEPDKSGFDNNYLADNKTGSTAIVQKNVKSYNKSKVSDSDKGPLRGCTTDPVTRLTNSKSTIEAGIKAMGADGYTHIPVGIVWGWRLISPGSPFTEGAAYSDTKWKKAIVILTDGENTIDDEGNDNKSNYGAYGHLYEGRMGTTSDSTFEDNLNKNTSKLCSSVKAEGIRVYTITFDVSTNTVRNLMKACASEPSLYFDSPSGAELDASFEAIARDLNNLRISK